MVWNRREICSSSGDGGALAAAARSMASSKNTADSFSAGHLQGKMSGTQQDSSYVQLQEIAAASKSGGTPPLFSSKGKKAM